MKKALSFAVVLLLTVIYSWVVSLGYASPEFAQKQESHIHDSGENYFSFVSVNLFSHTFSNTPLLECIQNGPSILFVKDYSAVLREINSSLLWKSKIVRCVFSGNTLLVRNRKSDLIFPFHYFW